MDYVHILPLVEFPEAWIRSTLYHIVKEVYCDAVSKFMEDSKALIVMEFGGVYGMLQKEEDGNGLIFKKI